MNEITINDFSLGLTVFQIISFVLAIVAVFLVFLLLFRMNKFFGLRNKQLNSQNKD